MKNLFLILFFTFISVSAFSQDESETAGSLLVINKTNCRQFFAVFGAEFCECRTLEYATSIITIAPGEEHYYENSTMLSSDNENILFSDFPPHDPQGIVMVRIVDRGFSTICYQKPEGGSIGQCIGKEAIYRVKNDECEIVCGITKAEWIPAKDCKEGKAQLIFTDY